MAQPIETFEHNGYTVNIYPSEFPENPRKEFDQFGTMVCFLRDYDVGDEHSFANQEDAVETLLTFHKPDLEDVTGESCECNYCSNEAVWSFNQNDYLACDEHREDLIYDLEQNEHHFYEPDNILIHQLHFNYRCEGVYIGNYESCDIETAEGFIYATGEDIAKNYGNCDPDRWMELVEAGFPISMLEKDWVDAANKLLKYEVKMYNQYLTGEVYWIEVTTPDGEHVDSMGGVYGYDYAMEEAWEDVVPPTKYVPPPKTIPVTPLTVQPSLERVLTRIDTINRQFFTGSLDLAELKDDVEVLRNLLNRMKEDPDEVS